MAASVPPPGMRAWASVVAFWMSCSGVTAVLLYFFGLLGLLGRRRRGAAQEAADVAPGQPRRPRGRGRGDDGGGAVHLPDDGEGAPGGGQRPDRGGQVQGGVDRGAAHARPG